VTDHATSVALGPHFEDVIKEQLEGGRYQQRQRVVRAGLPSPRGSRKLQALKLAELKAAIQAGIVSGSGVPAEEVFDRLEKKIRRLGEGSKRLMRLSCAARSCRPWKRLAITSRSTPAPGAILHPGTARAVPARFSTTRWRFCARGPGPGLRVLPYGQYLIFYRPMDTTVRIERILHGARDWHAVYGRVGITSQAGKHEG